MSKTTLKVLVTGKTVNEVLPLYLDLRSHPKLDVSLAAGINLIGTSSPLVIFVTLRSVNAFTAVYNIVAAFLEEKKRKTVTIENGDIKVTLKWRNLPDESSLMEQLFPAKKSVNK